MSLLDITHSGGSIVPVMQIGRPCASCATVVLFMKCIEYSKPDPLIIAEKASAKSPTQFPLTTSTNGGFPARHPTRSELLVAKSLFIRIENITQRKIIVFFIEAPFSFLRKEKVRNSK